VSDLQYRETVRGMRAAGIDLWQDELHESGLYWINLIGGDWRTAQAAESIIEASKLGRMMCVNGPTIGELATKHSDTGERSGDTPFELSPPQPECLVPLH
jgi:hypothetical protein